MSAECYPMSVLPHITRLYADYLAMAESSGPVRQWYAAEPLGNGWMNREVAVPHAGALADLLHRQSQRFGAGPATLANIELLRGGARAVVTGQQAGLFGGPLLTLLKAATAIARAKEASTATGIAHVPVFWLATEDHDLAEANQSALLSKHAVENLRLDLADAELPVGGIPLDSGVAELLDQVSKLLAYAPICDLLRECYTPDATFGSAFAMLMTRLFAAHGLIVLDARERDFHALGAPVLRAAIERAAELEAALLDRTRALESAGYQAQVLVKSGSSLLFLVDAASGRRQLLRRVSRDTWKAGTNSFTTSDLLAILDAEPERLSPNALLRPVFQDAILPTAAYIGGPAEIAYFAQSEVLYREIAGRMTPVLPRLSATLIEPAIATIMAKDEVSLEDIFAAKTVDALALRLGARAMPIEGKRRIAAAGNALDAELSALTSYLAEVDASLGRSANVSASKMRYQMNRLRRMAATFEVQKEASLRKHAAAMMLHLFPDGHPQERVLGGIWFLAQAGDELIDRLVLGAGEMCLGHSVVRI
jgi:bacillithiol biosynthesis cysteine-adding enzyme BshC